jgi:hypothetical protein
MSTKKVALSFLVLLLVELPKLMGQTTCPLTSVDAKGLPAPSPIALDRLTFQLRPKATAFSVQLQNGETRPINAAFFVVDFYKSDQYMLSMTFYAATRSQQSSFRPAAPFSSGFMAASPFPSSLLPGQTYTISADSTVRPSECPDKARIVVLRVVFSQGAPFDYRATAWRVDPWLLHANPWSLENFPQMPISVFVRVSIDETGKPRVIAMGDVDQKVSLWLTDQIEETLTFLPAKYEGAPIATEIALLFRFYSRGSLPFASSDPFREIPSDWGISRLTVIDLVSEGNGKGYELSYGGLPVVGKLSRT